MARGGEAFTCHVQGQATGGIDVHQGLAGDFVLNALDSAGVIAHRARVWHANHRSEASRCGGFRATADGFLVRLARVAEMHVDIDQAWRYHQPRGVDLVGCCLLRRAEAFDEAAVNGVQVADRVALICRVDNSTASNPKDVRH